ncbi:DUF1127 domain-containing protein [Thaumasiovibrio subtropicus]|uniref:DUF1127 domain-containing protein n=1 Tax=Thaumasiovibrio subtropicus TaxID=1891207 RepID=UPI000B363D04|nr:DUF1127 domain-containing protein [Thaumasiovibrio subtropicus]
MNLSHETLINTQRSKQTLRQAFRLIVKSALTQVRQWRHNYRSRRHLADLPQHLRDDIGYDNKTILDETRKPFWRE